MRAWVVQELGEPADVMVLHDVDVPVAGERHVVIRVEAAALNFTDVLYCRGEYQIKAEPPFTPGSEVAGTVTAVGSAVDGIAPGDRVIGVLGVGGLAEVAAVTSAYKIPASMSFPVAAASHVTYQTAHYGLHDRARIAPGETLLVHAGAGGVGSAAIQLGRAAGARVLATAGGAQKVKVCEQLGADIAIDYLSDDFVARVKELTDGRGADVIFDVVGGDVFDRSRKCIAFDGRLLVVGFTSGRLPEMRVNHVLIKNYAVVGVNWGLFGITHPEAVLRTHDELMRLYEAGAIDPLVSEVLPLEQAVEGLSRLATRATVGKVVCVTGG
jgi:NADPH2:quinone reductase